MADYDFLEQLEAVVRDRIQQSSDESYTASLARRGIVSVAQKVGEEGVEVALAAAAGADAELVSESADLVFHLLVALGIRGIDFASVVDELRRRHEERTEASS
jgi:phosphoribosyl-ATP pyrophosphohydrolase